MRPIYMPASPTTAGVSPAVILDQYLTPFNVTITVELGGNTGGGASYTVQYTNDDPYGATFSTTANWYSHSTLVNLGTDATDVYYTPVRATRLLTNTPGTGGTVPPQMVVVQAGVFG